MIISNALVKAIKDYILEDEDREQIVNELGRYKREFPNVLDYNWYKYGNILPYYSQIEEFYRKNGLEPCENNQMLQKHFEGHIRIAIDEILKENV